jgi:hypothetical protein
MALDKHTFFYRLCRNLQTRKEMRENAWQVDDWASTVHKARPRISAYLFLG